MAGFQVDRRLIFAGDDLTRPRMAVEQEKLWARFPGFRLYGTQDRVPKEAANGCKGVSEYHHRQGVLRLDRDPGRLPVQYPGREPPHAPDRSTGPSSLLGSQAVRDEGRSVVRHSVSCLHGRQGRRLAGQVRDVEAERRRALAGASAVCLTRGLSSTSTGSRIC